MVNEALAIREALARVERTRAAVGADPALGQVALALKHYQSERFARTYADLAANARFAPAVDFFLRELYSPADYAGRDAQFARVAGAMQRMLPADTLEVAVQLAQLHALTEDLDHAMACAVLSLQRAPDKPTLDSGTYVQAWRQVARPEDREQQLRQVLALGQELTRMTRSRGLGVMLKMMHRPAHAAGFGDLHRFLDAGFTTFATLNRSAGQAMAFLQAIDAREGRLIRTLADGEANAARQLLEMSAAPG